MKPLKQLLNHEARKIRAFIRDRDLRRTDRVDLRKEVEYTMLKRVEKCS